ncbi:MAG TPA: hypothetical protein VLI04_00740 [Nocardioidaceae bacterium]|nr:hypothetical protein [Nocardioidaceae bacterium]
MSLVSGGWLDDSRNRAAVAVGGCAATAVVLVVLTTLAGNLVLSVLLAGLGLGIIIMLTQGYEWTTHLVMLGGMVFAPMNSVRVTGFVTIADLLFVLGFALLTPTVLRRHLHVSVLFLVGWLVMLVVGLTASLAAPETAISFNHMTRLVVAGLMLPLAFMLWRPSQRMLVRLATAYLMGATFSCLYGATLGAGDGGDRLLGLTTHPNFLGLTAVLATALVPYVVAYTKQQWRWCIWLAGLVCVYGVWFSGSRAAFVALAALVIVYTVRESSVLMGLGMAAAGTVLLLFLDKVGQGGEGNALSRILGGGSAAGSDLQREQLFEVAMERFGNHPIIGNGFEHAMEAHSVYLQVAVSIGVIGVAGYLVMFLAMTLPMLDTSRANYRLAYPALTYALVGIFTNSLWDRFVWAVLALSMAGVVADNYQRGGAMHHPRERLTEPAEGAR